ncbi:hypothetical protein HHL19_35670 [Streptomyces sp. R302]|uniref:hypothetical protein n=1 Tax=unclassified Streptomyces TaxID=2593676 RepID=UPI00145E020B|nr:MULTISPECIES: hypothetical protein [unclassified Streptomyces]NML55121.1 hypothetical protein [Streptomyces sp. R301]NML83849.1 hypothetical protein [Streptomyces sp. R302]
MPLNTEYINSDEGNRRRGIGLSRLANALVYSQHPDAMVWHDAINNEISRQMGGACQERAEEERRQRLRAPREDAEAAVWLEAQRCLKDLWRTSFKEITDRFGVTAAYEDVRAPAEAAVAYRACNAAEALDNLARAMEIAGQDAAEIAEQAVRMRETAREKAAQTGMHGLIASVERRLSQPKETTV